MSRRADGRCAVLGCDEEANPNGWYCKRHKTAKSRRQPREATPPCDDDNESPKRKARRRGWVVKGGGQDRDPAGRHFSNALGVGNSRRGLILLDVESSKQAQPDGAGHNTRLATLGTVGSFYSPTGRIGMAIAAALDPTRAPSKVKTFADMTDEEKEEMRRLYEHGSSSRAKP